MGPASKDLLPLEKQSSSTSPLESALFICKQKRPVPRIKPSHPDAKPLTAPVHSSQVLGKVKDFLGVISEANRRLESNAKENPENYDIEVLNGNEAKIIEMDLMLGIADLHTPEAIAAAESAVAGYQPVDSMSASSSETESENSSDDDEDYDNSDDGGDHCGRNSRDLGQVKRSNACGDVSNEMTGKNETKKQLKRPKIIELS